MAFDFKAVKKSKIQQGVAHKTFLVYGQNKLGKTYQAVKFPRSLLLGFEKGYESLSEVSVMDMNSWKDFLLWLKEAAKPENLEWLTQNYETVVLDSIDIMIAQCEKYTCAKLGISDMGETVMTPEGRVDGSKNSYKSLRREFQDAMLKLINLGLTVVWVGHETTREMTDANGNKTQRITVRGDKGCVDYLIDTASLTIYLRPNGFSAEGTEIPSSAYLANTVQFQAGGRLTNVPPYLPVWSAENLIKAVEEGVRLTEEQSGVKAVTYEEIKAAEKVEEVKDANVLKQQLQQIVMNFYDKSTGKVDARVTKIIEKYLGTGAKVSAATQEQVDQLELILGDVQDLAKAESK